MNIAYPIGIGLIALVYATGCGAFAWIPVLTFYKFISIYLMKQRAKRWLTLQSIFISKEPYR